MFYINIVKKFAKTLNKQKYTLIIVKLKLIITNMKLFPFFVRFLIRTCAIVFERNMENVTKNS